MYERLRFDVTTASFGCVHGDDHDRINSRSSNNNDNNKNVVVVAAVVVSAVISTNRLCTLQLNVLSSNSQLSSYTVSVAVVAVFYLLCHIMRRVTATGLPAHWPVGHLLRPISAAFHPSIDRSWPRPSTSAAAHTVTWDDLLSLSCFIRRLTSA